MNIYDIKKHINNDNVSYWTLILNSGVKIPESNWYNEYQFYNSKDQKVIDDKDENFINTLININIPFIIVLNDDTEGGFSFYYYVHDLFSHKVVESDDTHDEIIKIIYMTNDEINQANLMFNI